MQPPFFPNVSRNLAEWCVKSEELASGGALANTGYCVMQPRKQALQYTVGLEEAICWQAEHIGERVTEKRR